MENVAWRGAQTIGRSGGGRVSKTNPKVDAWLNKAEHWQPEMRKLRSIVLSCGLGEELKWYKPVYTFGQKNVVIVMAMKETVALAFCKGALLKIPSTFGADRAEFAGGTLDQIHLRSRDRRAGKHREGLHSRSRRG